MHWLTKLILALLKFSLTRLFPGDHFVIWVFDRKKDVRASLFLDPQKDGSYSHKIILKRKEHNKADKAK